MGKHEEMPLVEGYVAEKRTISLLWANILSIGIIVVLLAVGIFLMHILWPDTQFIIPQSRLLILLILIVVGIVVHELIHGITWIIATHKDFSHLSFGIMKMSPYCHIDVPMQKRQYVVGALMPMLLLGVLPAILALAIGSWFWLLIGILFITAAAGDLMIVWVIRKEPNDTLVYDHPSEGGCYVYHKASQP